MAEVEGEQQPADEHHAQRDADGELHQHVSPQNHGNDAYRHS